MAIYILSPSVFLQPVFGIFKHNDKDIDPRETEADAALLADEVNSLLDNSLTAEISRSEEQLQSPPALERSPSFAASVLQTMSSPLKQPLGFKSRWSDRIRRHGQPIQVATGAMADVHERGRK